MTSHPLFIYCDMLDTIKFFIKKIDYPLIIVTMIIAILSVVIIDSITMTYDSYPSQVRVQMLGFALGLVLMIIVMIIDVANLKQFYIYIYILSYLIQLTVFIPGLGDERFGNQAWIDLGFTTLQPSEFVKITFIICFAAFLEYNQEKLFTFIGFLQAALFAMPLIGLVAVIDTGTGIIFFAIFIGMIFAAGIKTGIFVRLAIAFIAILPIAYRFLDPYQQDRFRAFLNPDDTTIEATHQLRQSKIAIGSGGFWGKGLGNGTIKESGFLPVQESDFIFAIINEELGLAGGLGVIACYAVFLQRIWKTITNARDVYSALICIGFLSMFGFQIFENIGMTLGIMPITGITLPFLSAGGTSVMVNMISLGIILGIGTRSKLRSYKNVDTGPTRY